MPSRKILVLYTTWVLTTHVLPPGPKHIAPESEHGRGSKQDKKVRGKGESRASEQPYEPVEPEYPGYGMPSRKYLVPLHGSSPNYSYSSPRRHVYHTRTRARPRKQAR